MNLQRIVRKAAVLLLLLVAGGYYVGDWGMALSVLIGAVVATVNFYWLSLGVDQLLGRDPSAGGVGITTRYLFRLLLILGTFFVIIHTSFLSLLGALAGLSVFVMAGILEAIVVLVKSDGST